MVTLDGKTQASSQQQNRSDMRALQAAEQKVVTERFCPPDLLLLLDRFIISKGATTNLNFGGWSVYKFMKG